MSCSDLDGPIREAAARGTIPASLRAHLDACADCRSVLAREESLLARIDGTLRAALDAEPSEELVRRINVRRESRASSRIAPQWLLAAASLTVVTVLAVRALRPLAQEAPRPTIGGPRPVSAGPGQAAASSPPATVATGPAPVASRVRPAMRPARTAVAAPPVIVPAGEEEALLEFYASQRRRMNVVQVEATGAVEPAMRPLAIAPLVMPALAEESSPSGAGLGVADSIEGGSR